MKLQFLLVFLSVVNGIYCQRSLRGLFDIKMSVNGFYSNDDEFHWSEFTKFMEKFNKTYTNFKELK